jgi:hypothetical protein
MEEVGLDHDRISTGVEALDAYHEVHPGVLFPLNNLAMNYMFMRENARAEEIFQYIFQVKPRTTAVVWSNFVATQFNQGKLEEADTTLRLWEEEMPGNPSPLQGRARQATALQDFARAAACLDTIEMEGNAHRRKAASEYRAAMAGARGRVREAERYFQDGLWTGYDRLEWSSKFRLFFLEDSAGAVVQMREGLATLDSLTPDEADPLRAAAFFARAGRPDLAREQVEAWEQVADEHRRSRDRVARRAAEGLMALAGGGRNGPFLISGTPTGKLGSIPSSISRTWRAPIAWPAAPTRPGPITSATWRRPTSTEYGTMHSGCPSRTGSSLHSWKIRVMPERPRSTSAGSRTSGSSAIPSFGRR